MKRTFMSALMFVVLALCAFAQNAASEVPVIDMVFVEGGTFQMGSYDGASDEEPVHNVTLSSYFVAKTEVTQEQWMTVMGNNPSSFWGDKSPVGCVSWYDAIVFCNKLSFNQKKVPVYSVNDSTNPDLWNYKACNGDSINGTIAMNMNADGYRLPTEAEWEYAARGGKKSKGYNYSGGDYLGLVAWFNDNSKYLPHEVGTKVPNELGLYDMSGNVWEWCWDWYESDYYSKSPENNPIGASSGEIRVGRGGSYIGSNYDCLVTCRLDCNPSRMYGNIGFRVVCSATEN